MATGCREQRDELRSGHRHVDVRRTRSRAKRPCDTYLVKSLEPAGRPCFADRQPSRSMAYRQRVADVLVPQGLWDLRPGLMSLVL